MLGKSLKLLKGKKVMEKNQVAQEKRKVRKNGQKNNVREK